MLCSVAADVWMLAALVGGERAESNRILQAICYPDSRFGACLGTCRMPYPEYLSPVSFE